MVNNLGTLAYEFNKYLEFIAAKAKTGIAFSPNPYDVVRFREILEALESMYDLLVKYDPTLANILSYLKTMPVENGSQEYVTPKVAVATVVFDNSDQVLLINRLEDSWALPGGYADVSIDPMENAAKELREETGLEIAVRSLVGIYDSNLSKFPTPGRHVYAIIFYGELCGGVLKPDPVETKGAAFFNLNSLPSLSEITSKQIEHAYRIHKGETIPAFVDSKVTSHRECN